MLILNLRSISSEVDTACRVLMNITMGELSLLLTAGIGSGLSFMSGESSVSDGTP